VLQGRAAFWGAGRLAYLADDASGHAGILVRDLARPEALPRPLVGFAPSFLPETFAFSPDGEHLAVSRLELQQNLVLADLRPRAAEPGRASADEP